MDVQKLFDIKKTQIEMVRDRGYDIHPVEAALLHATLQQFASHLEFLAADSPGQSRRSLLSSFYRGKNADGTEKRLLAFFGGKTDPSQTQIPKDVTNYFASLCKEKKFHEAIFIVGFELSTESKDILAKLTTTSWQVFHDSDLTYNPTSSIDTPRHELLSPEVARAKLIEMKVELSKLLILRSDDPIVKYYGWHVGSLIMIHRNDKSVSILAPKSINYRVVV